MSNDKSLSICLFVIICLFTFSGCSKPKTSYEYLNQARQEHQKSNDQAALIDLKNALKKDPKNGEARLLIAQIYNERGEGSAAEIELHKALDLGIDKSYVAAAMGKALFIQRKYQKVLDTINVAGGDKGKVAADIYNVRGDAYIALKRLDDAKNAFETALKEYPDSVGANLGLARLSAIKNEYDEAFRQTELILSKEPNNLKALFLKANLLRVQQHDKQARDIYKSILQIDNKNVSAYLSLAAMDLEANKLDTAKTEIDAALKIAPKDFASQYTLATIQFRRGKFQAAQDSIQEVLKAAPDYLPGVQLHGVVAFAQGSYEQALRDLSRVIAKYPGNAYARRLVATTHLKLGEIGPAMETLKPLLKPGVGDAEALAIAGEAQLKAKNYDLATQYLQQAITINPKAQNLQVQLAISHLRSGEDEQAMRELEVVAKNAPGQSPADVFLVVTHLQRKEYEQALDLISNLEKKIGSNPLTLDLRGETMMGKHNIAEARKLFQQALSIQPTYFPAAANLAQLDMHDKHPDEARKRFESIIEKDKNNLPALLALANFAASQKQDQKYVEWLERAEKAHPNVGLVRAKLVDYYLSHNDKEKALNIANDAVKSFPDSLEALGLLGTTQLAADEKENAVKTFTTLVSKYPKDPASYVQLATAQAAVNQIAEAHASLTKALGIQPDFQRAQELLIRLDLAEKKGDAALRVAHQIQAQQPDSPAGYDIEGAIYLVQKRYVLAVKAYEHAMAKNGGSEQLINLHHALNLAGEKKEADKRLASWIKQNPKDVAVQAYAANFYMNNGRNRDAITQYEEILKLTPQNVVALNNLASLYQQEGNSQAVATAEQALKLAPDNARIQDTLGWILVAQGKLSKAIELLNKAVAKLPKEGIMHYHLAVALDRSGRKADAKKELEAAIATGQNFSGLADAKAMLKRI